MSGVYTCGHCGVKGHTVDTCSTASKRRRATDWSPANANYQANRAAGRCDDCGRKSRKGWPSRQAAYRREHERRSKR